MKLAKTSRRTIAAAFAMALGAWSPSLAAAPALRKIVDTADPVPAAPTARWEGFLPFYDLAVDGEAVAFLGRSRRSAEQRQGVYVSRGGEQPLQLLADSDSVRPRSLESFALFAHVAMDDGLVAFTNHDFSGMAGAYLHDGHALQVVADQGTVIPGRAPERFTSVGDVAIHDGAVLFGGGTHLHFGEVHEDGLYLGAQGVLGAVVDASTPKPGGGTFELVGEVGLADGGFAFAAPHRDSTANDGVYRNVGGGVELVADLSTVAPHDGTKFIAFHGVSRADGATAFVGQTAGGNAIYLAEDDGPLQPIATTQMPYPGSGQNFGGFSNRVATSAGRVAFLGFPNTPGLPPIGLFVADGGELVKVAETGTLLDSRTVTSVLITQRAFDWPHLAFTVTLAGGREALYLATLPDTCTPGATTLCLHGGRFAVELDWRSPPTYPEQQGFVSSLSTSQTGFFYFVNPENLELMVKVLDGCALNGHYWVFAAAATNVEYTLKVTDTATDAVREYHNVLGERSPAVNDTSAFACP